MYGWGKRWRYILAMTYNHDSLHGSSTVFVVLVFLSVICSLQKSVSSAMELGHCLMPVLGQDAYWAATPKVPLAR